MIRQVAAHCTFLMEVLREKTMRVEHEAEDASTRYLGCLAHQAIIELTRVLSQMPFQ